MIEPFSSPIDTASLAEHDKHYTREHDLAWHRQQLADLRASRFFEYAGFAAALGKHPEVRQLHVDIGSGGGWLLTYTAPLFEKVMGIEPSETAVAIATDITKDFANVDYISADMIEGMKRIGVTVPAFVTTSIVLTHLEDYYVTEFLKLLNGLPEGSVFYFYEPYNKNIQRRLWHVRSQRWWAERLPLFELEFGDIEGSGYVYGIGGIKKSHPLSLPWYPYGFRQNIEWFLSGLLHMLRAGISRMLVWAGLKRIG